MTKLANWSKRWKQSAKTGRTQPVIKTFSALLPKINGGGVLSKRKHNPRLAKIHRNYSVEEIAELFGVHKNTIRSWIKDGLPVFDERKPMLILGSDIRDFLYAKKTVRKRKCRPWELYCVRCRLPQVPAGGMADYEPITEGKGRLIAICPTCDALMNKFTSTAKLAGVMDKIDVSLSTGLKHIS